MTVNNKKIITQIINRPLIENQIIHNLSHMESHDVELLKELSEVLKGKATYTHLLPSQISHSVQKYIIRLQTRLQKKVPLD